MYVLIGNVLSNVHHGTAKLQWLVSSIDVWWFGWPGVGVDIGVDIGVDDDGDDIGVDIGVDIGAGIVING